MVSQHSTLVPTLTVAENLLLGGPWWQRPARAAIAARFRASCQEFGIAIDPDALAGILSPGEQLQTEIVRALWRGGRVLVLDEPTAPLGPAAVAHLLGTLRGLRQRGLAIVLITHRLDEALEAADRVTVLRRGKVAGMLSHHDLTGASRAALGERIRGMMFGTPHSVTRAQARVQGESSIAGRPWIPACAGMTATTAALHIDNLTTATGLAGLTFSVAAGEILGIAGIDGNGQTALADALAGMTRPLSGEIRLDGARIDMLDAAARHRIGVRCVSDDRIGEGTVGAFPVALNLLLKQIGASPFWRGGIQRDAAIAAYASRQIADFDIRTPSPWTALSALSGGNMQKAMLARELHGAPRLIVYHKPTIGLDARSAEAVHARIRQAAADSAISIVISADLDEILLLSSRIAVLDRGRIAGVVANGPEANRQVAALMTQ